jgi:uncharacterized membrane protein YphA (DoxX/SURF4 family)
MFIEYSINPGKISEVLRFFGIMKLFRLGILTISRFFASAVFLAGAIKNILFWHETERGIMDVLADWQSHFGFSQELQIFFSLLISWGSVLLLLATVLMLAGGLMLLLGMREKLALSLLVFFLIPATILYHPFWWVDGVAHELQTIMFLKNLAILGCLLQLLVREEPQGAMGMSDEMDRHTSIRF